MLVTTIRTTLVVALLALAWSPASSQGARQLTLEETIRLAQTQGPGARLARQTLEIARYNNTAAIAGRKPQLSLDGSAVNFRRALTPIFTPDGETRYVAGAENVSDLGFTVSQRVKATGGTFSVTSGLARIDQFGDRSGQRWSSQPFTIGFQQDLLNRNRYHWEDEIEDLSIAVTERQYAEAREDAANTAVAAFFDLYTAEISLANARTSAGVADTIHRANVARFDRGSITETELLQSELASLNAKQNIEVVALNRERAEASLRRLLDLDPATRITLTAPGLPKIGQVDVEVAVREALANGSLETTTELGAVQAKRAIEQARLSRSFGARLNASVGYNQTAPAFLDAYRSPLGSQRLGLDVNIPLANWGAGKAEIEAAQVSLSRVELNARTRRLEIADEARFAVAALNQAQSAITISAKSDSVALRRFSGSQYQYANGATSLTEFLQAQGDLDAARERSAQAVGRVWTAYYRLRRVTMYDFEAGRKIDG